MTVTKVVSKRFLSIHFSISTDNFDDCRNLDNKRILGLILNV